MAQTTRNRAAMNSTRETTSSMAANSDAFTLKVDSGMFIVGFGVGFFIGKLLLRSTLLAAAFATGLGLAVGTSPESSRWRA